MGTIISWMISFPFIFMVSGMAIFAYIVLAIFFGGYIRMAYDHALYGFLWPTHVYG